MERSKSNKIYVDQEYANWRQNLVEKYEKDQIKIENKYNKIELKSTILREFSYLKINDMQTNFKNQMLKLKYKKNKWIEKYLNKWERIEKNVHEKQLAINK